MAVARVLRAIGGWMLLGAGLLMLAGWIGSSIPRNANWQEPDRGIDILLETNGVHTALILPARTASKDWHSDFPPADVALAHRPYTHVSISWGEREVFLNTPTWADLSPVTVLRILGIGGDGMLHIAHYVRPGPGAQARPITLRPAQYRKLVNAIEKSRPPPGARTFTGYGDHDVFYETGGRYTATRTCNQWTSDMLASAGVKTGWWTPFAGGVTKWVPASGPAR